MEHSLFSNPGNVVFTEVELYPWFNKSIAYLHNFIGSDKDLGSVVDSIEFVYNSGELLFSGAVDEVQWA